LLTKRHSGQAAFKNVIGDILEIIVIYRVNGFLTGVFFHGCVLSQLLLIKNVLPVPADRIVVGINSNPTWQAQFNTPAPKCPKQLIIFKLSAVRGQTVDLR
jgi:hypothetical protein